MKRLISVIKWMCLLGLLWLNALHNWLVPVLVLLGICIFYLFKSKPKPEKYINARGYVVLSKFNEQEHRYIATQILGRKLKHNEVVHHINGKKTDNDLSNLCLMDREKHEFFHSWLRWKKNKSGSYPPFPDQKRILAEEYGGTLLEGYIPPKIIVPVPQPKLTNDQNQPDRKLNLFDQLRQERKRLATERNIPLYMVFDNRTLSEISELMPESESAMLQITGVGPIKYRMYGERIISLVIKYKKELELKSTQKRDA